MRAGAALLMVLCCALPVLIAGGTLAGLGGILRSPWLIGAGALLLVLALIALLWLRRHDHDDCCPPTGTDNASADHSHANGRADR